MLFVIANIYNKKTEGPALMELFTATGKPKQFYLQLEMFDLCTTGGTAHIDTIFKFLPHTCQHGYLYRIKSPRLLSIDRLSLNMTALFLFETSATILQSTGLTSHTSVSKAPLRLPQVGTDHYSIE
jgi:hypothetical protein